MTKASKPAEKPAEKPADKAAEKAASGTPNSDQVVGAGAALKPEASSPLDGDLDGKAGGSTGLVPVVMRRLGEIKSLPVGEADAAVAASEKWDEAVAAAEAAGEPGPEGEAPPVLRLASKHDLKVAGLL